MKHKLLKNSTLSMEKLRIIFGSVTVLSWSGSIHLGDLHTKRIGVQY